MCVGLLDVNLGNRYFFNFPLQISDDINRNDIPRMPWHDCSVGVTGKVAGDFARHFIQRWNAHRVRFRHRFISTTYPDLSSFIGPIEAHFVLRVLNDLVTRRHPTR